MSAETGRITISRFPSDTDKQNMYYKKLIFCVLQIGWFAAIDIPFSSSKTTCSISTTSCWVIKSKGTPLIMGSLGFRPIKSWMGQ